ncbi:MAG: hypothetical protein KC646_04035 [Candidatus Cloacimonetes bacterium]|nr:hypothetical protein [Candidatus Cloacimonadota bacterium]
MAFDNNDFHVILSDLGEVIQISVYRPNKVILKGIQLLNKDLIELKKELDSSNLDFNLSDVGLYSDLLNIGLIEVDGMVDGVELY